MSDDRLVAAVRVDEDVQYEAGLRPRTLDDYIGQERVRENLHVSIVAARQRGEALFIDEVHRMAPAIEEILYPAMEDYELDIMIGQGPSARSVKVPLQRFTL